MDIEALEQIINSAIPKEAKESEIISWLASDKSVIPLVMKILDRERQLNSELITDMNMELSRAHVYIDTRPEIKSEAKEAFNKTFITDEIGKFYYKYKSIVNHCFNRFI